MVAEWWNGIELWMSGLPFAFQFILVIVVLGPLCVGLAWAIDRTVDHASTWFGPAPGEEEPIGTEPVAVDETPAEELVDSASR